MAPQAVWFVAINGRGRSSGVSDGHSADIAFEELRGALGARPGAGPAADAALLRLPPLKVSGGLDGLLAVGDEAARRYADVLGALARMRRTHAELARACGMVPDERVASQAGAEPDAPPVDGRPAADALLDFAWDAAAMPARKPLAELVAMAARRVADLDEELRAHAADAAAKRGDATALAKRLGGPIGTRDLAVVVDASAVLETEHVSTLFVALSASSKHAWLSSYERWAHGFVVPRSSRCVASDGTGELWSVHLFRRVKDSFVTSAREAGFTVREHPASAALAAAAVAAADGEDGGEERATAAAAASAPAPAPAHSESLEHAREAAAESARRAAHWAASAHAEALGLAAHIASMRCFVEGCLRYGIPPTFAVCAVRARAGAESACRASLAAACAKCGGAPPPLRFVGAPSDASEAAVAGAGAADAAAYPYVSVSLPA